MDIQKYIQSGILENYALGLLSDEEVVEVEQNLRNFPELREELQHLEDALTTYAQTKAIPMPEGLSDQILQSIENSTSTPSSLTDKTPIQEQPRSSKSPLLLGSLLGLSLLGGCYLFQQKQAVSQELLIAQTQAKDNNDRMLSLQLSCDEKDSTIQRLQEQLSILKDPTYHAIYLKGTDKAPNTKSIVYFNTENEKTYLDIGNLPTISSDKDYQLWAIVNGTPTDMGVINLKNRNGLIEVPHIINPEAFAVTLETKGGNPVPNLEELYVIGNV